MWGYCESSFYSTTWSITLHSKYSTTLLATFLWFSRFRIFGDIAFWNKTFHLPFCCFAGGLGGIGLQLCQWLIQRGAQKLVLNSRNGISDSFQGIFIYQWISRGIHVSISTGSIAEKDNVEKLLNTANSLGPVAGIFNLAGVRIDNSFKNFLIFSSWNYCNLVLQIGQVSFNNLFVVAISSTK